MARIDKRFGVAKNVGTTYVLIATVPALKRWITHWHMTNKTAGTVKVYIYIADPSWSSTEPTGGTLTAALGYGTSLESGEVFEFSGPIMEAADKIVVQCNTLTAVDIVLSGQEIDV